MPEQALGWLPLCLSLVVEDEHSKLSCILGPPPSSSCEVESDLNKGFSEDQMDDIEESSSKGPENSGKNSSKNGGEGSSDTEGGAESSLLVSSSVGAWDILIGLMSSLKCVSRLYLEQGIVKEAHHYAREGAMLAKGLLLPGW